MANTGYNSVQIYAPKGWIVAGYFKDSVCAWGVNDNGDVAPRWKIPVQRLSGYEPLGFALDPIHKEIIISSAGHSGPRPPSGIMNTVITFSWP